jgi:TPR repeat protein
MRQAAGHIMLAVAIAGAAIAGAVAGPFEDAAAAYERGDYETALHIVQPLANQGNARAQYNLGIMYLNGTGVPQDPAEAAGWFRKAATQGNAGAQYNLGVMYLQGQGVAQDRTEAAAWVRKAADQGYAIAQYNLGLMHLNGHGVPQDEAQAANLYVKAANQGFAPAQGSLGLLYATGHGVKQDAVEAHKWFSLAARGTVPGRARDGWLQNLDQVAKTMTPEQIAEATRRAQTWKPADKH